MKALAPLAILIALIPPAQAETPLKGWSGPKPVVPCRCRHAQGKAALGETICRRINGKMVTLRCDKVLNNTSWTQVGEGCTGQVSYHPDAPNRYATFRAP